MSKSAYPLKLPASVKAAAQRPNILLILVDDLGWTDLACCGSEFYETPNLDRLCGEGMRFTDAYAAAPVCSPTRASLLTGKYPATVGITDWIDWQGVVHPARGAVVDVPYLKDLPASEHSLAAAPRPATPTPGTPPGTWASGTSAGPGIGPRTTASMSTSAAATRARPGPAATSARGRSRPSPASTCPTAPT